MCSVESLRSKAKYSLCWFSLLLFYLPCFAQQKKFDRTLSDSLKNWVATDQVVAKAREGKYKLMPDADYQHLKDSIFAAHYRLLSQVFDQHGFPGYDLVGKAGSDHFWLMVQHCDKWPDFQLKVLKKMQREVERSNADPKNFAYLTDRVNLNLGKKQVYGTQLQYNTKICQAIPKPMADSLQVNRRRKAIGMEPVEVYLNQMTLLHFQLNKAQYEAVGIREPALHPVPAAP